MSDWTNPPFKRQVRSVGAELSAHLEQLIESGHFSPGQPLPSERALAAELQVSRSSLREALHELEARRLIERRQGKQTVVAQPADELIVLKERLAAVDPVIGNAIELRNLIEPQIAFLATMRATPSGLLQLESALVRSSQFLEPEESMRLDIEFHLLLSKMAKNPLLLEVCSITTDLTRATRLHSHATLDGRRTSVLGHQAIYAAVSGSDAAAARSAMERHLGDVHRLIADNAPPTRLGRS